MITGYDGSELQFRNHGNWSKLRIVARVNEGFEFRQDGLNATTLKMSLFDDPELVIQNAGDKNRGIRIGTHPIYAPTFSSLTGTLGGLNFRVWNSGTAETDFQMQTGNGENSFGITQRRNLHLKVEDTKYVTIDTLGNVGIGTTSPSKTLHISGGDVQINNTLPTIFGFSTDDIGLRLSADVTNDRPIIDGAGAIVLNGSLSGGNISDNWVIASIQNNGTRKVGITGNGTVHIYEGSLVVGTSIPGNTYPNNKLEVEGSAVIGAAYAGAETAPSNGLLVEGDVGIGTISPSTSLDVNGDAQIYNQGTNSAHLLTVRAGSNQGAGRLMRFLNNAGTELTYFSVSGDLEFKSPGAIDFVDASSSIGHTFNLITGNPGGLGIQSNSTISIATGGTTERVRINADGDVGIGTTSPDKKLEVLGTDYGQLLLTRDESTALQRVAVLGQHYDNTEEPLFMIAAKNESASSRLFLGGASSLYNAATSVEFYTAPNNTTTTGNQRMKIDSAGNVGIGTNSPNGRLHVNGNFIQGVVTMAADDITPDVSGGNIFITSANGAATAITDLDNPQVGQVIRIIGGSNTNPSTIADAGNFNLSAAWTANLDDVLILFVQADNDYIEVGRVDN